jgi:hypothetical protein
MKKPHYNFKVEGWKRLKTAAGVKLIDTDNRSEIESQVQQFVNEHQAKLIGQILNGLPAYVDYRFHERLDSDTRERITRALCEMKREPVSIETCEPLVEELIEKEKAVVESKTFYYLIDQKIKQQLWP